MIRPLFAGMFAACLQTATAQHKPADLPDNYRDVQIYTTSVPSDNGIGLTIHLRNRGDRALQARLNLDANEAAGFPGITSEMVLLAGTTTRWDVSGVPPPGLQREILHGNVWFGETRARELFIALQRIGNVVKAVGTHAPRVRIDWWRSHPSSSRQPDQRRLPLITLAAQGETEYAIVCEPMPIDVNGRSLSLDAWAAHQPQRPGELLLVNAVRDLQQAVETMSGGGRMRITGRRPKRQPVIVLSLTAAVGGEEWPHQDACHLRTSENGDVFIEAMTLDGLRQGIYGLLGDHLDCHWFLPGEVGAELPRPVNGVVQLGQIEEVRSPSFFSNRGTSWSAAQAWDCRNRSFINRGRMTYGHAWTALLSKNDFPYEEHPDMWARNREGKLLIRENSSGRTNFCSSNPEVIEFVAAKINKQLSDPNVLVASLDPNDYSALCQCDRCLAVDAAYGADCKDGVYVTDRLLHFSQEIYDRLEPVNREKYLGILVYAYQIELPTSAVPHDHHTGMICNMAWTYDHTRPFTDPTAPTNVKFYELLKGWGAILPQFGYYDYYGHWRHFGPWGQIQKMREDLPAFRDVGGTYLMLECQPNFAMQGLNHYIAGRLSWDVDADVDVLLEEFFEKFYGSAAGPMRQFWLDIEMYYALLPPGPHAGKRVRDTPGMWEALWVHLDAAGAIVAELPDSEQRYRDRIAFTRDGFDMAYRQYCLEKNYVPPGDDRPPRTPEQQIQAADEALAWFAGIREKYADRTYWPPLLPDYFAPRVEHTFNQAKEQAQKALPTALNQ